jgi:hypothetical protein
MQFIQEQLEAVIGRLSELQEGYDEYVKLIGVKKALETANSTPVTADPSKPAPKRRGRPPKNPAAQA